VLKHLSFWNRVGQYIVRTINIRKLVFAFHTEHYVYGLENQTILSVIVYTTSRFLLDEQNLFFINDQ
jgi:hypothetical protein